MLVDYSWDKVAEDRYFLNEDQLFSQKLGRNFGSQNRSIQRNNVWGNRLRNVRVNFVIKWGSIDPRNAFGCSTNIFEGPADDIFCDDQLYGSWTLSILCAAKVGNRLALDCTYHIHGELVSTYTVWHRMHNTQINLSALPSLCAEYVASVSPHAIYWKRAMCDVRQSKQIINSSIKSR